MSKTNFQPTGGIRLHELAEVAHELRERGADLAMFDDERLWVSVGFLTVRRLLDVCFMFPPPTHFFHANYDLREGHQGGKRRCGNGKQKVIDGSASFCVALPSFVVAVVVVGSLLSLLPAHLLSLESPFSFVLKCRLGGRLFVFNPRFFCSTLAPRVCSPPVRLARHTFIHPNPSPLNYCLLHLSSDASNERSTAEL